MLTKQKNCGLINMPNKFHNANVRIFLSLWGYYTLFSAYTKVVELGKNADFLEL